MDFNASGLLLSLSDLFVVILPGFIMLAFGAVIYHEWRNSEMLNRIKSWSSASLWGITLVGCFLVGHFISQFGSLAEDCYWSKNGDTIKAEYPELRTETINLAKAALQGKVYITPENVRRWAAVLLRHQAPALGERLDRLDVERRFFRNLAVVFWIAAALAAHRLIIVLRQRKKTKRPYVLLVTILFIIFGGLSAMRYLYESKQFTQEIFENFIVVNVFKKETKTCNGVADFPQAGGIGALGKP